MRWIRMVFVFVRAFKKMALVIVVGKIVKFVMN